MSKKQRIKRNAQAFADRLHKKVGLEGWIIVDGFNWYGPHNTKELALGYIGLLDSLDMQIEGVVVKAG